ncbi:MAG: aldo/keto reductase [Rhodospirillaceae bacterium]|nr:aldo/keto reductase [Rhodospirillaceae bacterium]MBT4490065.1 aldo/keto reductase [Rhodospirillaceae bacterium]MBT5190907.1 aldo/keto reductase [Rhodospirillaceae bacterium]MBT5898764.1 aldo/keto reductase [Rhodospirillaceae bacterium]MBT7758502.1 aldo/keto reductase [Rhodospirillaceae bacterium]
MKTKQLGSSDLDVPVIGLGCMVLPGFYGPGSEEDAIATLHKAVEFGVNFLDSSDLYGAGENEELIGRAVAGRRDDYIIATKFGNVRTVEGKPGIDGRPEYVQQACEASLKRLGIDVIDLYYQHRVDTTVPIEDTVGAMARLIEQGKVRHLGLSEAAVETVRRAHATHPITALQSEYSLWSREVEDALVPVTAELGIGFVAYSPLGRGMFGGDITGPDSLAEGDRRRDHPRFQGENLEQNVQLVEPVRQLAAAKGVTTAQIALAWLLSRGEHIFAIPGTRRVDHLKANAAVPDIVLTADEIAGLDAEIQQDAVQGTRYPAGAMAALNR